MSLSEYPNTIQWLCIGVETGKLPWGYGSGLVEWFVSNFGTTSIRKSDFIAKFAELGVDRTLAGKVADEIYKSRGSGSGSGKFKSIKTISMTAVAELQELLNSAGGIEEYLSSRFSLTIRNGSLVATPPSAALEAGWAPEQPGGPVIFPEGQRPPSQFRMPLTPAEKRAEDAGFRGRIAREGRADRRAQEREQGREMAANAGPTVEGAYGPESFVASWAATTKKKKKRSKKKRSKKRSKKKRSKKKRSKKRSKRLRQL
jgi:hypothetical protein